MLLCRSKKNANTFCLKKKKSILYGAPCLGGSVGCTYFQWSEGCGVDHRWVLQHSFVENDHEIFSTVILPLPLIQEGQLSVSGERMCTSTGKLHRRLSLSRNSVAR